MMFINGFGFLHFGPIYLLASLNYRTFCCCDLAGKRVTGKVWLALWMLSLFLAVPCFMEGSGLLKCVMSFQIVFMLPTIYMVTLDL